MTGYEIISLVITGVSAFVSSAIAIILGIVSYRLSKKQIETDKRIAEMQKDMDDKNLKANMLDKRMECYEYVHSVFRTIFDISDASPYYLYHNSSFYELLNDTKFNFNLILDFHLNLGKISGLFSQSVIDIVKSMIDDIQKMYEDIDSFKFEQVNFGEDEEIIRKLDKIRIGIITRSREIKNNCLSILEMMINEMKV